MREIVAVTEELDVQSERFKSLVVAEYEMTAWPQKLSRWWAFDFKEFVRATKLKLSIAQKDELLTFWSGYQKTCSALDAKRDTVDAQIDASVYKIYELEPAEIAIVESKIGKTADNG